MTEVIDFNEQTQMLADFIPVEKELPACNEVVLGVEENGNVCLCMLWRDFPSDGQWWVKVKGLKFNKPVIDDDDCGIIRLDIKYWHKLPVFKINESNDER